jgi:D-alanyl-lipoteichoic acid acyltransferase DltB (MBOAT superfamily)
MSFQSYPFLLLFLPALGLAAWLARRFAPSWYKPALIAASLLFHASWALVSLPLFLGSIALNRLAVEALHATTTPRARNWILNAGIIGNLAAILALRDLLPFATDPIPALGVSFYSFTQIAYLLDTNAGVEPRRSLTDYLLFVAFFPAQIAGPILTAREVMPTLTALPHAGPTAEDVMRGLGIFLIGLLKKTLLADPLATTVATGYAEPAGLDTLGAWRVALSYFLQLYFDFSGYSDMAVGLALLFGLRYPWNFASPYQARGVIEYWSRWHISLTRFFMTALHAPLAMAILRWRRDHGYAIDRNAQRRAPGFAAMHAAPLLITMSLAGLWHGLGANFLVFGLLHGGFLAINHLWRLRRPAWPRRWWRDTLSTALTCLCVLIGSVFFRAEDLTGALDLLRAMASPAITAPTQAEALECARLGLLLALVWLAPNTQTIMAGAGPWSWRPRAGWAWASGVATTVGLLAAGGSTEFLYARF